MSSSFCDSRVLKNTFPYHTPLYLQGEGDIIPMAVAHTPSTLGKDFNSTLDVLSALGGAEEGVGVTLHHHSSALG